MDRGRAEREPVGDLLDAQALREQLENLALAGGQLEQLLDLPAPWPSSVPTKVPPPATTSIARAMSSLGADLST